MATEEGIVIHTHDTMARVETTQSRSCKACTSRESCHVAGDGKRVEVLAINLASARKGDRILMQFETGSLLKACFLIYILPVGCMLMGAIGGHWLALSIGGDPSILSALSGFSALIIAVVAIRLKGNQMGQRDAYKPKIMKIIKS